MKFLATILILTLSSCSFSLLPKIKPQPVQKIDTTAKVSYDTSGREMNRSYQQHVDSLMDAFIKANHRPVDTTIAIDSAVDSSGHVTGDSLRLIEYWKQLYYKSEQDRASQMERFNSIISEMRNYQPKADTIRIEKPVPVSVNQQDQSESWKLIAASIVGVIMTLIAKYKKKQQP